MSNPLPLNPESADKLKARYARAVEYVYDQKYITENNGIRPGEVAANVFDFEDGVRFLISRERMLNGGVVLHISASIQIGSKIEAEMIERKKTEPIKELLTEWLDDCLARFLKLSGIKSEPKFLGFSKMLNHPSVPHWIFESEVSSKPQPQVDRGK